MKVGPWTMDEDAKLTELWAAAVAAPTIAALMDRPTRGVRKRALRLELQPRRGGGVKRALVEVLLAQRVPLCRIAELAGAHKRYVEHLSSEGRQQERAEPQLWHKDDEYVRALLKHGGFTWKERESLGSAKRLHADGKMRRVA